MDWPVEAALGFYDAAAAAPNDKNNAAVNSRLLLDTDEGLMMHHNVDYCDLHFSSLQLKRTYVPQ